MLSALDPIPLVSNGCLLGGGTAMALRYGEYRESVNIDFLVSHLEGYRALRQLLTGPGGVQPLVRAGAVLKQAREIRADQYGLRTLLEAEGVQIKFEIVLEARMQLAPPGAEDQLCGIATLTPLDMAASKLLANSDRWADDSVFSRDLIDLAMMQPKGPLLAQALAKARLAYGSVEADLLKAVEHLRTRPNRLERCMQALQMTQPKALLWQRIRQLAASVGAAT